MIPNKIHWCWFSGEPLPESVKKYMKTWDKMGCEIIKWDSNSFDINSTPKYIQDAYNDSHWAMVSDYIRAYALYTEGGWYFDSDVEVVKPIPEEWRNYNLCATFEVHKLEPNLVDEDGKNITGKPIFGNGINTAMFGAIKNLPYLKDVMDFYNTLDYNRRDYQRYFKGRYIAPQVYAYVAEKYGYTYDNQSKVIDDDMFIAPETLVVNVSYSSTRNQYISHHCAYGWRNK